MINLGDLVKDKVTGFIGTAVSKIEYITGCIQFGVLPKMGKDKKYPECNYIDDERLVIIKTKEQIKTKITGGEMADRPRN